MTCAGKDKLYRYGCGHGHGYGRVLLLYAVGERCIIAWACIVMTQRVCMCVRMSGCICIGIISGGGRTERQVCMVHAREPGQTHNVESRMRRRKISTEGEKGLILTTAQDAGSPWVERKHGARSTKHGTRNANINTGSQGRACTCDGHDLPCEAGGCIRDADDAAGPLTLTLAGSG